MNSCGETTGRFARRCIPGLFLVSCFIAPLSFADLWDDVAVSMQAGDHRAALTALERAGVEQSGNVQIHRVMGICHMELGNLSDAEEHLKKALELSPDNIACRYYLAQVLALKGDLGDAKTLLHEVIDLAPGSSYARRSQAVLPGLEKLQLTLQVKEAPSRWDFYVRVAGEHDDNVPARSRHAPQDDTESARLVASAHVGLRILDQKLDEGMPTLGVGYTYYGSYHDEEMLTGSDVMSHKGSVELKRSGRIFGKPVKVGVKGTYTETDLGEEPYSEDVGAEANVSLQLNQHVMAILGYSMHWKEFENDTETPEYFSRDGTEQEATTGAYFYFFDNSLILGLIYRYMWNDVDGSQFALERHKVTGSATVALPLKARLYASITYANKDYVEYTPDPQRLDDAYTGYVSLSRELWNEDWRFELNATFQSTDSNQDFAEYDRTVYGAAVSWSL